MAILAHHDHWLPRDLADPLPSSGVEANEGARDLPPKHPDGTRGERRLLLVEDDFELRRALSDLLRGDGYQVVGASNGAEALDILAKTQAPDLILLDLMMPVKDGWQFRIEQKRDPTIAAIPVVALSADESPKAVAIDAEAYIKKPFNYATLLAAIERVIEERRLAHLERLASLGTLAAGIAHEINNPLTYLIANLELLEEDMPRMLEDIATKSQRPEGTDSLPEGASWSQEVGARLHDALEGAKRIRGIVSDVKMFSRAGDDHRANVDVRSVLDSSLRVVMSEIRQRARLVKAYEHIPLVLASPGQLGQVFLNLLVNAAHAIDRVDPENNTIRVSTRTSATGEAVVEIADTGCGIEPEVQRRIFDPFFTTKPVGVGTGLGLSICHGIVRALGGTITVESQPGSGATFRVMLPAAKERAPTPSIPIPSSLPNLRARILVVDDERQVAQAVKDLIGDEHEMRVVTTSTEALALLMQERVDPPFDLIICDLHMPGMSGMDMHDKLATLRPSVAARMIFMTGGAITDRARTFLAESGSRCIDKPIDVTRLRRLISKSLVRRQS